MTALAASFDRAYKEPGLNGWLLEEDAVIHQGAIVAINADGYLVPAADTANFVVVGVAEESVDNTGGADGDAKCRVRSGATFKFAAGGAATIAQASVGDIAVVLDDATVQVAADATNDIAVGRIVEVESDTVVWVFIPFYGSLGVG